MDAEISFVYPSTPFAKSVMQALRPDNELQGSGMRISAKVHGRTLKVQVRKCEKIETLQMTLQDIFRCVRAAETALSATEGSHRD